MPLSKLKVHIAEILKREGYIDDFSVQSEAAGTLTIVLKYGRDRSGAIVGIVASAVPAAASTSGTPNCPRS